MAIAGTHFSAVADDRTGALETAGACADVGFASAVVPGHHRVVPGTDCVVVDIGSRHLAPKDASARARSAPPGAAHKIDSSLRGNWAHELVARHHALGRPVLVVPAFPAAGRTCRDGIVLVDGLPAAESAARDDVRAPVRSSRPSDHLRAAGAAGVIELTADALPDWLDVAGAPFAVCDALTGSDLARVAAAWAARRDVVIAGTAATIAAAAAAVAPGRGGQEPPLFSAPALVVCGSLHPVAEAQVDALVAGGARRVHRSEGAAPAIAALRVGLHAVLAPGAFEREETSNVPAALAAIAQDVVTRGAPRTVVVIGGETAAAVVGGEVIRVGGTVGPGVAWCPRSDGSHLVTKPGGFGGPSTIIDLFRGARR